MVQKEVSSKDKVLLPLFALSLILIAFLVGNIIPTFIIILLGILIVAFVYSIIKVKTFDKNLIIKIKESSYVLAFSALITLIFIIILPYLFFHNSFLNMFVIQYVYLFPILVIFFSCLFIFNYIIKNEEIQYKHLIKSSLIIAIVLSLIISGYLLPIINNVYNDRTKSYNRGYDETIFELNEKQHLYSEDLPIFNEIKSYQDEFLEEANGKKEEFQNFDSNNGSCIKSNCAKIIVDKAHHLIEVIVNSEVIKSMLEKANEESESINSKQYEENFASMEDYSFALKNKIDESDFTITEMSKEHKEILHLFESGFTYDQYEERIKKDSTKKTRKNNIKEGYASVLFLDSGSVFETDSLFYNSRSYTIEHSVPFKELFRLIFKTAIYTEQQGKNPDLFVDIYENKDIDEPVESKVIRYKLILDRIEE